MNSYRVNQSGLAYMAQAMTEATGKPHEADSPAVYAAAAIAEDSAATNDNVASAQVEILGTLTVSGRPEVVWLRPEHVDVTPVADE